MLSTSHNFLFVHIPKTAGNSIQDALRLYADESFVTLAPHQDGMERFELRSAKYNTTKHSTLADYEREYGARVLDKLFKFTCVRNPWDRCMSFFFSPHRGAVEWDRERFASFIRAEVRPVAHYLSRRAGEPLEQAVRNVDFVVRHEALETDLRSVCERVGLPEVRLAHRNASSQPGHRRFYDAATAAAVRDLFAQEIEYFGYSFDPKGMASP